MVQGGASPRYLATANGAGHLLYVNQATLFAIRFDLNTLTTRGTAVPVVDDVAHETLGGVGQFDVSRTGTLVYRKAIGGASSLTTLQWVDATGRKEPLPAKPGAYQDLSLSPDGTQVALLVMDGGSEDIWVYDIHRDAMTRLTFGGAVYRSPRWSPDGRLVIFSSVGNGIFEARADGASQPHALMPSKVFPACPGRSRRTVSGWLTTKTQAQQHLDGACGRRGRPFESRDAGAISQEHLHRFKPVVLAGRAMAGVSVERIGHE